MMEINHTNDLPLMANTRDFLLYHYILDLECDLEQSIMSGDIFMFLKPSCNGNSQQVFSIQEYQERIRDVMDFNVICGKPSYSRSEANSNKDTRKSDVIKWDGITKQPQNHPNKNTSKNDTRTDQKSCQTVSDTNANTGNVPEASEILPRPSDNQASLILDCCDIDVHEVCEVSLSKHDAASIKRVHEAGGSMADLRDVYSTVSKCSSVPLPYLVEKWCITVWKHDVRKTQDFPRIVKIRYSTKPQGASLRWTKDQDGRRCVYSAAMWINNRALFPCAEFGNLSTWQAMIRAPEGTTVLMSGDNDGQPKLSHNGTVTWYQDCCVPMPPFTLALAIGYWDHIVISQGRVSETENNTRKTCSHILPCQVTFSKHNVLPCRLFAPPSVLGQAEQALATYWPKSTQAVQEILGPHPFPRVDLVIYPPCSQDLALANPNLVFLSQSLLAKDQSMCIRVSHELTHSWFGLLIGARDWTEEWLSEGFATYMEDSIHAKAMQWTEEEQYNRSELRALIRHRVLSGEMAHTKDELQTLRPNPEHEARDAETSQLFVKNGLNPEKLFTQVHYLKGYFLLRYLAQLVGVGKFDEVLRSYIEKYHGQLVLSKEFLELVFDALPELQSHGLNIDRIYAEWLDVPGIPKGLEGFQASPQNKLYSQVMDEVAKWKAIDENNRKRGRRLKQQKRPRYSNFEQLEPDQLVLLLEELLEEPAMSPRTQARLRATYKLHTQNADVRHRWGEIVIKHCYSAAYSDVRHFLIHDQAMGVYLYGEMVLSGCGMLRALAKECFNDVQSEMEAGTRKLVHSMLYGEPA